MATGLPCEGMMTKKIGGGEYRQGTRPLDSPITVMTSRAARPPRTGRMAGSRAGTQASPRLVETRSPLSRTRRELNDQQKGHHYETRHHRRDRAHRLQAGRQAERTGA